VVKPVELNVRNAQVGCEPGREGGLARTCIAGDQQSGRHAHAETAVRGLILHLISPRSFAARFGMDIGGNHRRITGISWC